MAKPDNVKIEMPPSSGSLFVNPGIPHGAEENTKLTELIFAASRGDANAVSDILKEGKVHPDTGDYDARTALHIAACENKMEVVEALVQAGASVNVVDRWHETPLDGATRHSSMKVARFLIKRGGVHGNEKQTALSLLQACDGEDKERVENYLSSGVDPNLGDYDSRTPLHIAVAVQNVEIAKLLVKAGANVHAVDRFGGTPMSDAEARAPRFGSDPMRDFLLENGGKRFADVEDDNRLDFAPLVIGLQILFLVLFGIFVRYGNNAGGQDADASHESVTDLYAHFQDVHVMIFIGFGMLMLFLKKYAYSSISYTLLLAVVVIQWHILVAGFFHNLFEDTWQRLHLSLSTFILADFAAAAVLITFGALLGKVKPVQLLILALLEIVFFSLNEEIGKKLAISDVGGSMVVHTFGAYFGLAASVVLTVPEARNHKDNAADYRSDVFSMVGTVFLWMFWPSFNSALAGSYDQERVIINTILALSASATMAFSASHYLRGDKKFDMVDIQNATLAGGVAVGTTANMMIGPLGALCIGFLAGWLSVFGYVFVSPFLESVGIHDTCGVHNLHGMPGVLAGIAGVIFAGTANISNYGTEENLHAVFSKDRSASNQAAYQGSFLLITLSIAILSGLLSAFIARTVCGKKQPRVYNDDYFFERSFR